jgi:predicted porin
MKKSLIALAVAGAFAAPAFAATGNVDVYGKVRVAIEDTDISGQDMAVVDRVSRIGFKGSEDLGGGLKAIWQIESGLGGGASGVGTGTLASRNTFVGLAGSFGTFLVGRHDTPYKLGTGSLDPFSDTLADYNNGCLSGCIDATHDYRSPQAIAYISPTWSGFHFAVAGVATNTAANLNSGDTLDALSATAVYANGPLFGSLSYQNVELGTDAWKLGVGYTFGDFKVAALYESVDVDATAGDKTTLGLNGTYNMGPIALKAAFYDQDNFGTDSTMWALGADYSLSKRTSTYVVFTNNDIDGADDVSGWAVGLNHDF